jgi:hypothetical protein
LTSPIVTVNVANTRKFYLHFDLLVSESDKLSRELNGSFKEAETKAIDIADEDPDLFGFFVEYMYRDRSILSREIEHYSEYVTLARLYAMGERLLASRLRAQCLWRFTQNLHSSTVISEECVCDLLQTACNEITERVKEDPLRAQIFWYAGRKIANLQKSAMFRQLLRNVPEVGQQICLWVDQSLPPKQDTPIEAQYSRFEPESEYSLDVPPPEDTVSLGNE